VSLPKRVVICGIPYKILYVKKRSEVDGNEQTPLVGQINYWTREIRLLDTGQPVEDVWQELWHEVLHGIRLAMKLDERRLGSENELDLLAVGINDVIFRNRWLKEKWQKR